MKKLIASIITVISVTAVKAQIKQYDPLLDSSVKILSAYQKSHAQYIWYPGQLSAHLQQIRLKESTARCLNVGYPGNFYKPLNHTSFQKEFNLSSETTLQWISTGNTKAYINNNVVNSSSTLLPKGKSVVRFEVNTQDYLPAIKVIFNNQPDIKDWKVSLDEKDWNLAETSTVFGTNGKLPLDDPETLVQIDPVTYLPLRNATVKDKNITISKNGYVLIDFFHLEMGKVSFTVKGTGKLTAYVGESPEETLNENTKFFEQKSIESYNLTGNEMQITLPERAVRYLKLSCGGTCEISSIHFEAKVWPVDFQMSFECSDERINTIWNASVASLHTSTHGFYLDGIKRDYLPWSMDAVLSTFAGDYIFGDEQVSKNSLSVAMLPLNPQKTDLGIPDYPLHGLIGFNQHYHRYGDFNTILAYRDRIEQLLKLYEMLQDERGFISANVGVSWGFVPGWATKMGPDKKGTPTYAQIMLYYNYKIGADFCGKWGDRKAAEHYKTKADFLKKNILSHFWNEEKGMFINGYAKDGKLDKGISHHAQYWAVLADIFPQKHLNSLFKKVNEIPQYREYVSYEKGYEFLAYSKARNVREMWNFLFDVFGDWLNQGHSRFPENFSYKKSKDEQLVFYNRPYGLSLCHGANGAPGIIAALHGIGGFSQSDKELNHYTINPDLMDLEWANISFPVKEGKIILKLTKNGKKQIEIPAGCKVDFIDKQSKKITLNKPGVTIIKN